MKWFGLKEDDAGASCGPRAAGHNTDRCPITMLMIAGPGSDNYIQSFFLQITIRSAHATDGFPDKELFRCTWASAPSPPTPLPLLELNAWVTRGPSGPEDWSTWSKPDKICCALWAVAARATAHNQQGSIISSDQYWLRAPTHHT